MLQRKHVVVFDFAIGGVLPGSIVEHVTVLIDFDKRCSAMFGCAGQRFDEVFGVKVDRPRNKGRLGGNCHCNRIKGMIDRSQRRTLGDVPGK